ncbi:MAG: OmpA family protein [Desulfovibrionaceae bacterium]|nr:OmpA family protein [Desulfovibrionaceae bacterium]
MKKIALALALLAISACNYVDPSLTKQTTIYKDAPVRLSELAVPVSPKSRQYRPLSALLYPPWVQQQTTDHLLLGRELGRIVHQAWTGERLFPTLAYGEDLIYNGPDSAVARARAMGADLVILGFVPYFFAGHTLDDTAITLKIDIHETKTGQLICSMLQSARMEKKMPKDWIYFRQETRMSDAPFYVAVSAIAKDMAVVLKSWLPPASTWGERSGAAAEGHVQAGRPLEATTAQDMERDLVPDQEGKSGGVILKVNFAVDSYEIPEASYPLLDELGKALSSEALKTRRVVLSGHTDSDASKAYNQTLSENRARAVKIYLTTRFPVDPDRIMTRGYGKTRPLAPNTTPANKLLNRRVEVGLAG